MHRNKTRVLLLSLLAFSFNKVFATTTTYHISPTGLDSNPGTFASPFATSTKAFTVLNASDTVIYDSGTNNMYTSTANPGANLLIDNTSLIPHGRSYVYFMGWSTSTPPVFEGYSQLVQITLSSYIYVSDMVLRNGSDSKCVAITDSSYNKIVRVGAKNGVRWDVQYGNVMSIDGTAGNGSNYNLMEDCYVIGAFRYAFIVGGTAGFCRYNILRRPFSRFDGSNTPEPIAGVSLYGATSGVDGSETNLVQNPLAVDFANSTAAPSSSVYAAFYMPHTATGCVIIGGLALANRGGRCAILGEDSARMNAIYNSVCWDITANDGLFTNSVNIDSITARGNTVYMPNQKAHYFVGATSVRVENNILYRSNTGQGGNTIDFNQIFPSTSSDGGTNESNVNPTWVYITSSPSPGLGLGGANIGATINCKEGTDGTTWGQTGYNVTSTNDLWPWPMDSVITTYAGQPDTGQPAIDNPGNSPRRGFVSVGGLTKYIFTYTGSAEPTYSGICSGAAVPVVASKPITCPCK